MAGVRALDGAAQGRPPEPRLRERQATPTRHCPVATAMARWPTVRRAGAAAVAHLAEEGDVAGADGLGDLDLVGLSMV